MNSSLADSKPVFINRIGWARTYMKKASLLANTRHGFFQITPRGATVLKEAPSQVNVKYLERFPEFLEFRTKKETDEESADPVPVEAAPGQTPHEALKSAY